MNKLLLLLLLTTSSKILFSQALDPKIIKQFPDSGRIENGYKEGQWVEYTLDSIVMDNLSFTIGDKKTKLVSSYFLKKDVGTYLKNSRTGIWIQSESYSVKPPFHFERRTVRSYKNEKKDGEETVYQGYANYQVPLTVKHWENGIENGIGKSYDNKYPFRLHQLYKAVNGEKVFVQSFYPLEKIEYEQTDTLIKGIKLIFIKHYLEKGPLEYTGYYNGEQKYGTWSTYYESGKVESVSNLQSGNYKYYYENGQLCTERFYKGEKLIKVVSNFTQKGEKNNPGTLKNGTGILNIYDPDGKLTEAVEYVNGIEKNK